MGDNLRQSILLFVALIFLLGGLFIAARNKAGWCFYALSGCLQLELATEWHDACMLVTCLFVIFFSMFMYTKLENEENK